MTLSVDRVDVQEFLLEFAFKTCDLFFCDPALCTAVVLDLDYIVKSLILCFNLFSDKCYVWMGLQGTLQCNV